MLLIFPSLFCLNYRGRIKVHSSSITVTQLHNKIPCGFAVKMNQNHTNLMDVKIHSGGLKLQLIHFSELKECSFPSCFLQFTIKFLLSYVKDGLFTELLIYLN